MYALLNKTERLITTHLGDQLIPGTAVAVSEVTMENATMQEMATAGAIEVTEIQDPPPPPPDTTVGGLGADRVGGSVQQPRPAPGATKA